MGGLSETEEFIDSDLINEDFEETMLSRLIEGSVIVITAALVAMLVTDLNLSLSLCGATYACYIFYFLPSGAYLVAIRRFNPNQLVFYDRFLKYIALFSICYGIFVCVTGITAVFL